MKAYLVTFTVTTRVVVNDDANPNSDGKEELFNAVSNAAFQRIMKNDVGAYLCPENCEINPDDECPAGTFDTDKDNAI